MASSPYIRTKSRLLTGTGARGSPAVANRPLFPSERGASTPGGAGDVNGVSTAVNFMAGAASPVVSRLARYLHGGADMQVAGSTAASTPGGSEPHSASAPPVATAEQFWASHMRTRHSKPVRQLWDSDAHAAGQAVAESAVVEQLRAIPDPWHLPTPPPVPPEVTPVDQSEDQGAPAAGGAVAAAAATATVALAGSSSSGDAAQEVEAEQLPEGTTPASPAPVAAPLAAVASPARGAAPGPQVYMDFTIDDQPAGPRVFIHVFTHVSARAHTQFLALARGRQTDGTALPHRYTGSVIHRIKPGHVIQGGDVEKGDGTGRFSLFEHVKQEGRAVSTAESVLALDATGAQRHTYKDDADGLRLRFDAPYMLGLPNGGPDTNTSQFFITLAPKPSLNGKHVIFGRVVSGYDTLEALARVKLIGVDKPAVTVRVAACGIATTAQLRIPDPLPVLSAPTQFVDMPEEEQRALVDAIAAFYTARGDAPQATKAREHAIKYGVAVFGRLKAKYTDESSSRLLHVLQERVTGVIIPLDAPPPAAASPAPIAALSASPAGAVPVAAPPVAAEQRAADHAAAEGAKPRNSRFSPPVVVPASAAALAPPAPASPPMPPSTTSTFAASLPTLPGMSWQPLAASTSSLPPAGGDAAAAPSAVPSLPAAFPSMSSAFPALPTSLSTSLPAFPSRSMATTADVSSVSFLSSLASLPSGAAPSLASLSRSLPSLPMTPAPITLPLSATTGGTSMTASQKTVAPSTITAAPTAPLSAPSTAAPVSNTVSSSLNALLGAETPVMSGPLQSGTTSFPTTSLGSLGSMVSSLPSSVTAAPAPSSGTASAPSLMGPAVTSTSQATAPISSTSFGFPSFASISRAPAVPALPGVQLSEVSTASAATTSMSSTFGFPAFSPVSAPSTASSVATTSVPIGTSLLPIAAPSAPLVSGLGMFKPANTSLTAATFASVPAARDDSAPALAFGAQTGATSSFFGVPAADLTALKRQTTTEAAKTIWAAASSGAPSFAALAGATSAVVTPVAAAVSGTPAAPAPKAVGPATVTNTAATTVAVVAGSSASPTLSTNSSSIVLTWAARPLGITLAANDAGVYVTAVSAACHSTGPRAPRVGDCVLAINDATLPHGISLPMASAQIKQATLPLCLTLASSHAAVSAVRPLRAGQASSHVRFMRTPCGITLCSSGTDYVIQAIEDSSEAYELHRVGDVLVGFRQPGVLSGRAVSLQGMLHSSISAVLRRCTQRIGEEVCPLTLYFTHNREVAAAVPGIADVDMTAFSTRPVTTPPPMPTSSAAATPASAPVEREVSLASTPFGLQLGTDARGAVFISAVKSTGSAHGLMAAGDVLVHVNGVPMSGKSLVEVEAALRRAVSDKSFPVRVGVCSTAALNCGAPTTAAASAAHLSQPASASATIPPPITSTGAPTSEFSLGFGSAKLPVMGAAAAMRVASQSAATPAAPVTTAGPEHDVSLPSAPLGLQLATAADGSVVVADVKPTGSAQGLIKAGDVIVAIAGVSTLRKSLMEVNALVKQMMTDKAFPLSVRIRNRRHSAAAPPAPGSPPSSKPGEPSLRADASPVLSSSMVKRDVSLHSAPFGLQLGADENGNVYVTAVRSTGSAHGVISVGDILLKVKDVPTIGKTLLEVDSMFRRAAAERSFHVRVRVASAAPAVPAAADGSAVVTSTAVAATSTAAATGAAPAASVVEAGFTSLASSLTAGKWTCNTCLLQNADAVQSCASCEAPRSAGRPSAPAPAAASTLMPLFSASGGAAAAPPVALGLRGEGGPFPPTSAMAPALPAVGLGTPGGMIFEFGAPAVAAAAPSAAPLSPDFDNARLPTLGAAAAAVAPAPSSAAAAAGVPTSMSAAPALSFGFGMPASAPTSQANPLSLGFGNAKLPILGGSTAAPTSTSAAAAVSTTVSVTSAMSFGFGAAIATQPSAASTVTPAAIDRLAFGFGGATLPTLGGATAAAAAAPAPPATRTGSVETDVLLESSPFGLVLGTGSNGGIVVLEVKPQGSAHGRIAVGSAIVSMNGTAVAGMSLVEVMDRLKRIVNDKAFPCRMRVRGDAPPSHAAPAAATPVPAPVATTASASVTPTASGFGDIVSKLGVDKWTCNTCLTANNANVSACAACEAPRDGAPAPALPPPASLPMSNAVADATSGWKCRGCSAHNGNDRMACASCKAPAPLGSGPSSLFMSGMPSLAAGSGGGIMFGFGTQQLAPGAALVGPASGFTTILASTSVGSGLPASLSSTSAVSGASSRALAPNERLFKFSATPLGVQLGTDDHGHVIVTDVTATGSAHGHLRPGDRLLLANDDTVENKSLVEVQALLKRLIADKAFPINLRVVRDASDDDEGSDSDGSASDESDETNDSDDDDDEDDTHATRSDGAGLQGRQPERMQAAAAPVVTAAALVQSAPTPAPAAGPSATAPVPSHVHYRRCSTRISTLPLGFTLAAGAGQHGAVVSAVMPTSPYASQVCVGAKLCNINGDDVSTLSLSEILLRWRAASARISDTVSAYLVFDVPYSPSASSAGDAAAAAVSPSRHASAKEWLATESPPALPRAASPAVAAGSLGSASKDAKSSPQTKKDGKAKPSPPARAASSSDLRSSSGGGKAQHAGSPEIRKHASPAAAASSESRASGSSPDVAHGRSTAAAAKPVLKEMKSSPRMISAAPSTSTSSGRQSGGASGPGFATSRASPTASSAKGGARNIVVQFKKAPFGLGVEDTGSRSLPSHVRVHSVNPASAAHGTVAVGDLLMSIGHTDVRSLPADEVISILRASGATLGAPGGPRILELAFLRMPSGRSS